MKTITIDKSLICELEIIIDERINILQLERCRSIDSTITKIIDRQIARAIALQQQLFKKEETK